MGAGDLTWTADELLATDDDLDPLFAGGRRCHGGFAGDGSGRYISPRSRFRVPAIAAWQAAHVAATGMTIIEAPVDDWPGAFPNVAQARFLLSHGVQEPFVAILTRIGTVEGFGALVRFAAAPDLQASFDDPLVGTATAHLAGGLFEAHARDEAGHEDQAGHREMWFAARDIAFEHPVTTDETALMLERLGLSARGGGGGEPDPEHVRRREEAARRFPDIAAPVEMMLQRMLAILMIEVQAFQTFVWAEAVLGDGSLVAGDGAAGRLVSYIRADETPHVDYLRTAVTEMRDRRWIGVSGRRYDGRTIVEPLWDMARTEALARRDLTALANLHEIERALEARVHGPELLAEFHSLGG
jgi:hypothetical protein